jgi:hypothetical protein
MLALPSSLRLLQPQRPRSLTLRLDVPGPRQTYCSSFPAKKYSEMSKTSRQKTKPSPSGHSKVARPRAWSVEVAAGKDKLVRGISKAVLQAELQHVLSPKPNYRPKIKYKLSRSTNQHRLSTAPPDDQPPSREDKLVKRLTCIAFDLTQPLEGEEEDIVRAPNVYLRTTNGRRNKFDGYMYLRRIKTKCEQTVLKEIQGAAVPARDTKTQRSLYIHKENLSQTTKSFLANPPKPGGPSRKRLKTEAPLRFPNEMRPWSSCQSERSC